MRNSALVELTVRWGEYGEQQKSVAVQIGEDLTRELMEGAELSDDPFSLMMAMGCLSGRRMENHPVVLRRRIFKMRRAVAEDIARAMVPALMKAFGVNDELDGYRVSDMSEEEREYQAKRGRLRE
jgi:hypothetical protein